METITLRRDGSNGRESREREKRRSADVASAHTDVASAHAVIPKKRSIRVGMVGTQNDHKEAARSLRAREKKLRTYCTADTVGDLRRQMDKSARLANI